MTVNLFVKGFELSTKSRTNVSETIEKKFDRMLQPESNVRTTIKKEHRDFKTSIVTVYYGATIRGESIEPDMMQSLNNAIDDVKRKMRRIKTKTISKSKRENAQSGLFETYFDAMMGNSNIDITKTKTVEIPRLTEREAICEADMLGYSFYAYSEISENGQSDDSVATILYLRRSGSYGKLILKHHE